MQEQIPREVLAAFAGEPLLSTDRLEDKIDIQPVGGGLINHSYRVRYNTQPGFLLQRINKHVFERPEQVQENYITLWQYAEFEFTGIKLPFPKHCGTLATLFVDENEEYWRAFEYMENTVAHQSAASCAQAFATASAFATFTAAFDDFNVDLLKPVIHGFHDLSLRFHQFEEAIRGECYERAGKSLSLIEELKSRERYKHFYELITESSEFPQRVMHHDAKIANVLFCSKTGEVVCIIDFDTAMPGYFFSDLGDMIRSMICAGTEDATDASAMEIREDIYNSTVEGYLKILGPQLTAAEKKYIHYAGPLMVYMQALRFLTDYLNNDQYYHTTYPDQNFDRAVNQLQLLKNLELFLSKHHNFPG